MKKKNQRAPTARSTSRTDKRTLRATEVTRDFLGLISFIMGPESAAARALADADAHVGPVRFFNTGHSVLVEKQSLAPQAPPSIPKATE